MRWHYLFYVALTATFLGFLIFSESFRVLIAVCAVVSVALATVVAVPVFIVSLVVERSLTTAARRALHVAGYCVMGVVEIFSHVA